MVIPSKALSINCVESYGRKKDDDSHAEKYSTTDKETSIPSQDGRYASVCVRLMNIEDSNKLVIGTFSCNLLVTSSCTIDTNPEVCVGSETTSFKTSSQTQIFLNKKSVVESRSSLTNTDYHQRYLHSQLEQLKQVRSKFSR